MKTLSKYFINGLIVIVPFAITVFVVVNIFELTEGLLGRHLPIHFPGIGLVAVLTIILLTGWLSSHWLLRRLLDAGERLLSTIPFVKFIYNSVKQLSTAVLESQQMFRQAALVPFPHPEARALGFVMPELAPCFRSKFDEEHVCVFIPMSLNMTAGFNIIVPKRDIIPVDITSESALQYVLTAGAVMPRNTTDVSKS
ncbi:MAG: DUF502 domain-containing protein [Negativicutes bacterium]|nr:DUF502 domain-containing protein [Negativicutes bacterium]